MSNGGLSAKAKAMLAEVAAKPAPQPQKQPRAKPTPEQMRRGNYRQDTSQAAAGKLSVAYRRQPLFETLAKTKDSGVDKEGLEALRFYRTRYEETAHSPMRCALDIEGRGGSGQPLCLPPGLAGMEVGEQGQTVLERLEAAIGAVVDTMRAVALHDQSYSDVAIARFGSRRQSWIEQEKRRGRTKSGGKLAYVEKIVPKSGRHREIIRDEFLLGLKRLVRAVSAMQSTERRQEATTLPSLAELTRPEEPAPPPPAVDSAYLDEHGRMRPWHEIAAIIRERVDD